MNIIDVAKSYIGADEGSAKHHEIIDGYNSITNGYKMTYFDPWCAAFVSYCAKKAGVKAPVEVNTEAIRGQVKSTATPKPGYYAFFDWNGDGVSDHIGIVEKVEGNTVYVISGNYSDSVMRTTHKVSDILCYGVVGDGSCSEEDDIICYKTEKLYFPDVRYGTKNEFVSVCQGLLVARGFDVGRYGIDGDFGNDTLNALKQFQKEAGLYNTAVCDKYTWSALLNREVK